MTEGILFPWVVSDFSLIDAIESGIVKVPRVPVSDNAMIADQPVYRDLWSQIKDELPKKSKAGVTMEPRNSLPYYRAHSKVSMETIRNIISDGKANPQGQTPPVMIIVCNNTTVSKLVYDWVAGYEKTLPDGNTGVEPGRLQIFSNEANGQWLSRPNTILVDSEQLESGEAMKPEFKRDSSDRN